MEHKKSNVDERFELLALIFCLAERPEYCGVLTDYQKMLNERFAKFAGHKAVTFARDLQFGYDAVASFAIHMERAGDGFGLIENRRSLLCGRWNETNVEEFLPLVNKFYTDTNFTTFFQEHMPVYELLSERYNRQLCDRLNKDWFTAHGLQPDRFNPIVTPSNSSGGYGVSITDWQGNILKVCPTLPDLDDYSNRLDFLVHECCHCFSNPKGDVWYQENETFRQQCDDSVDPVRLPSYNNGATMAVEYITRANTILYMVENENADIVKLMLHEKTQGFPYIAEAYALATNSKPIELPTDLIKYFLGMDYKISDEEHSFHISNEYGDRTVRWRFIDLLGKKINVENFSPSQVGDTFGTQTGDVAYVTDGTWTYVGVDIGAADASWGEEHRSYSVFLLGADV